MTYVVAGTYGQYLGYLHARPGVDRSGARFVAGPGDLLGLYRPDVVLTGLYFDRPDYGDIAERLDAVGAVIRHDPY